MLIKDNVTIGIEWRFGPEWLGQRCSEKTRRGTAYLRPANKNNGRFRLHGGASTGARTADGRARISAATLRRGKFTKDKLEKRWALFAHNGVLISRCIRFGPIKLCWACFCVALGRFFI